MTVSDVDNRRNALIETAARLFRTKGYDRTTVRDIARAVGLQSGSIFYHFRNKEEILYAVMEDGIRRIREQAAAAIAPHTDPRERLQALFHAHLRVLLGGTKDDMVVLLYEWQGLSEESRAPLRELRDAYEQLWEQVLTEAEAAGLVDDDPRLLRRVILGALNWTVQWFRHEGPLTHDELAARMFRMMIREPALASNPAPAASAASHHRSS